ncbi:response regulator transcription factor [Nesterenkonia sp. E16_10]|uniref:response regulator transcription factor n=3 Tax=unclassified Nesterenkonia TaxID=2629769 RepID=UPI001A9196CB|nr:response regulator transcription factor [Nesterenkonia sp. E16_10]MBO0596625.1 response regulator transcription factor [Nesterenkonia sp. E16_10]
MLVDDQHLLRMGFRLILEGEEDLEVVAEAADGIEALQTLNALPPGQRPDVVLMDVRMPRMDGIEATTKVVAQFPQTRVIILTTFDLDEYAFSGLQAGASAFLLKDVTPEDLVHAVRVVAEGDAVVAPRITQRLLEVYLRGGARIAPSAAQGSGGGAAHGAAGGARGAAAGAAAGTGRPLPDGREIAEAMDDGVPREPLTQRETEMLFAVAEGLSNAEIAAKFFLSEATVKTHVRRILTKLQLRDRVQAVVYVFQTGLLGPL